MTTGKTEKFQVLQHAVVVSDKKLKKFGLKNGDVVMMVGVKQTPVKPDNPYLLMEYYVAIKVVDGVHQVPLQGNDYKTYLVDPNNFAPVSEEEDKKLTESLKQQYGRST